MSHVYLSTSTSEDEENASVENNANQDVNSSSVNSDNTEYISSSSESLSDGEIKEVSNESNNVSETGEVTDDDEVTIIEPPSPVSVQQVTPVSQIRHRQSRVPPSMRETRRRLRIDRNNYTMNQRMRLNNIENTLSMINEQIYRQNNTTNNTTEEDTTTSTETQHICCVCYKELKNDKNHIRTLCDHDYCTNCFFRWIERKTTCAVCRRSFCTRVHLSNEELEKETSALYRDYSELLTCYLTTHEELFNTTNELRTIKFNYDNIMKSQQSLSTMIHYSKGYLKGYYELYTKKINNIVSMLENHIKNNIGSFDRINGNYKQGYNLGVLEAYKDLYNEDINFISNKLECDNDEDVEHLYKDQ